MLSYLVFTLFIFNEDWKNEVFNILRVVSNETTKSAY
jgi:hypothetical protein